MKKPGLIVAAYPGMGQEIFTAIFPTYVQLSMHDYRRENEDWAKQYAKDAFDLVNNGECEVCFIDPHKNVIKYLGELTQSFMIFYPGTKKDAILKNLAIMYFRNPSVSNGKSLADVVLNHDQHIGELRLYPNSVSFSTGIINEDFLKQLLEMDMESRTKVIKALKVMKTSPKRESVKKA
jgi:hypothetical protein